MNKEKGEFIKIGMALATILILNVDELMGGGENS
jgi:hypothetical protein